jgi:hypothetical protein
LFSVEEAVQFTFSPQVPEPKAERFQGIFKEISWHAS